MRASQLFTKTSRVVPVDEPAKNAQLLIRAGFIDKQMAGVYAFLPLGKRVLDNIVQIIREEMDAVGGTEISLTALQPKDIWETTGRWSGEVMDVWFKTKLTNGNEAGLAPTHEEPLTNLMSHFITSYKDLPCYPYQFQIKFRNELRAKSGLLRCREFLMKDLYSFSRTPEEHEAFYNKMAGAYHKIFKRLGIGDITYTTFASGGSFSKFSHEFQTVCDIGEDTIYIDEAKKVAVNKEVLDDTVLGELGLNKAHLVEKSAIEVGNIFGLGTRYSKPLNLTYTDKNGQVQPVYMGSYGIGPGRLMGTLVELFSDDKGLVWPETIAPFKVYLAQLGDSEAVKAQSQKFYNDCTERGIAIFWDDRDERPGIKFNDADLFGIPYRVVISKQTIQKGQLEVKKRAHQTAQMMTVAELIKVLANK
jgi:prolyl-tRNA synthetase